MSIGNTARPDKILPKPAKNPEKLAYLRQRAIMIQSSHSRNLTRRNRWCSVLGTDQCVCISWIADNQYLKSEDWTSWYCPQSMLFVQTMIAVILLIFSSLCPKHVYQYNEITQYITLSIKKIIKILSWVFCTLYTIYQGHTIHIVGCVHTLEYFVPDYGAEE